jgi:hypothetical protein
VEVGVPLCLQFVLRRPRPVSKVNQLLSIESSESSQQCVFLESSRSPKLLPAPRPTLYAAVIA